MPLDFYRRKLYALLQAPTHQELTKDLLEGLACFGVEQTCRTEILNKLRAWWNNQTEPTSYSASQGNENLIQSIASSSDRVNLQATNQSRDSIPIRHPISGQEGEVKPLPSPLKITDIPEAIQEEIDSKKVFWWFWRLYSELWLNSLTNTSEEALADGLLYPAHRVLPDCPLHSYQATVSALTGAMFPEGWQEGNAPFHPYLLIFTFSPIQDFIKASRKFVDFWAGSYLLHYLSARLCWHIADKYGPDAVIVPSLWGQDIIDAFCLKEPILDRS